MKSKSISKAEIEWRRRGAKGVFDRKNDQVIPLEQDYPVEIPPDALDVNLNVEPAIVRCIHDEYWVTCKNLRPLRAAAQTVTTRVHL